MTLDDSTYVGKIKIILAGIILIWTLQGANAITPAEEASPARTSQSPLFLSNYRQTKPYTCGPAALRVALSYWRFDISEDELARRAGTDETGTTMLGLAQAARQLGFNAQGERWNWERLVIQKTPVIAYIGRDHFVVMESADDHTAIYFDPASGKRSVQDKNSFQTFWQGEILLLWPTQK